MHAFKEEGARGRGARGALRGLFEFAHLEPARAQVLEGKAEGVDVFDTVEVHQVLDVNSGVGELLRTVAHLDQLFHVQPGAAAVLGAKAGRLELRARVPLTIGVELAHVVPRCAKDGHRRL